MAHETRIYGPPGTGKTSKLANEIVPMLSEKYGAEKIMLTSFTKAAAKELGTRIQGAPIIGTLHSICYKALNHPSLTEEHLADWNQHYAGYSFNGDSSTGRNCSSEYQIYRNKMIPRDNWRFEIKRFAEAWEGWKIKNWLYDFIDLIEEASGLLNPPGSPAVIIIDEAQDFTKLEMKTLRQWATQCSELWVVGDEDQALYSFSGASAENMLIPELPPEQKIILGQSWRIPRAVHVVAERIIKRVTVREPKQYKPREVEGSVSEGSGTFNAPDWVIDKALSMNGSSMIIVSCNYMLQPIIQELRNRGIPFANPWRKEEKSWNPLDTLGNEMLKMFLDTGEDEDYWDTDQFLTWAEHLKVGENGLIRKQGKAGIKQLKQIKEEHPDMQGLHTCREYLEDLLSPAAVTAALKRDISWFKENITKAKAKTLDFPLRVLQRNKKSALLKTPNLFVGTVHSFKGAETDNVFLYPDISFASTKEAETKEGYENLCRLFYVGVTRAKENLFLMPPATKNFFVI